MARIYRLALIFLVFIAHQIQAATITEYQAYFSTRAESSWSKSRDDAEANLAGQLSGLDWAKLTCSPGGIPEERVSWYNFRYEQYAIKYDKWTCDSAANGGGFKAVTGLVFSGWSVRTRKVEEECEAGRERDGSGQCVCKAGTVEPPGGVGACVPDDDTQCDTFYALGGALGGWRLQERSFQADIAHGSRYCMEGQFPDQNKGCIVEFDRLAKYEYDGVTISDGFFDKPADMTSGFACTPGSAETPKPPDINPCPNGFPGTVNGLTVCQAKVPNAGIEPGSSTTTVDNGTDTTTTRRETKTTCEAGRCTTTTTTTTTITNNSTGTSTTTTGTNTTTQSQSDYCKATPTAKLCGGPGLPNDGGPGGGGGGEEEPGSFQGSCAAGFQCAGDAVQCAIAREQHIRACKLFDDKSPESELYELHKGKEGSQVNDLPGNETISIGDRINSTDALGAGAAGLSDLNLTVWKTQVTIPLSMLNEYLAAMGNVLLAVSFLVAFRIVARG